MLHGARDMRVKTLLCVIFSTWIGVAASEEKFDLRSFLLQILNKVKTDAQAETLTGINIATAHDSSDSNKVSPAHLGSNIDASVDPDSHQEEMIKDAIERITTEIANLKAKYRNELETTGYNADTAATTLDSEKNDDDVNEVNGGNQEHDYLTLIRKMKNAAKRLSLLRLKLVTETGISDEDLQRYANEESKITEPLEENLQQKESTMHRLIKILAGIESNREKDVEVLLENEQNLVQTDDELKLILLNALRKGKQNVSTKSGYAGDLQTWLHAKELLMGGNLMGEKLVARNWHTKYCRRFNETCGGWKPMCCGEDVVNQRMKVPLCCSLMKGNMKNIDDISGKCLPNPFGRGECPY